uniref:Uncharacterized protein n=1 Tax=Populus trichocarpa TaxID=3694 RepID=U7DYM4_POPTR
MAPRKKAEETKSMSSEKPATRRSARMTRSTARRFNAKLTELPTESGKKRKQEKAAESKEKKILAQAHVMANIGEAKSFKSMATFCKANKNVKRLRPMKTAQLR